MTDTRLTIAHIMVILLYLGVSLAALRSADAFWASATFTLAIVIVSVASIGAFARKARDRLPWAGFAVAGWASLIIWLSTGQTIGGLNGPPLQLLSWVLSHYQSSINPQATGGRIYIAYTQVSHSIEVVVIGLVGSIVARFVAVKGDRPVESAT
jgi:hypothetical protein